MLDTGLPHRIRAKGVDVVLVAGWETRSAGSYEPYGSVNHHTAGAASGTVPSLATVIYGRTKLPGPLCNVLQSREPNPTRDKAYVIAAGRANHAGKGGWRGLSGNSRVGGLEIEHTGTAAVHPARLETAARIQAALLEAPGSPRRAEFCCQHFEWAPDRKIDFHSLAPWTPDSFRARVAYWIGRTAAPPAPRPEEDDDMTYLLITAPNRPAALVSYGQLVKLRDATSIASLIEAGVKKAAVTTVDYDAIERVLAAREVRLVEG